MLPGPGALLRRALLPIATLRDPTFGSAAEFMSWALIGLQGAVMRIPVCAAAGPRAQPHGLVHHACLARAVAAFFEDPDLPAVLRHWRPRAKSRAAECLVAAFGEEDGTRAARLGAAALAVRLYGGSIGVRPLVKAAAPQSVLGLLKRAVIVAETANARVQLWRYHRSLRR
jgi:hypothetical protein